MNSEPARIFAFFPRLASQAAVASNITAPHDWLGSDLTDLPRRHVDSCPLSSKSGDPNVFSVNTLFWKIRVTRVQQQIFHREFSVSVRYFEPSRASPS